MSIVAQKKPPISETHPELAKRWSDKNFVKPSEISFGSNIQIWWVCNKGHEWLQSPHARLKIKCAYCSNRRILVGDNDILTLYPWVKEFLDETEYKRLDKIIPRGKGHVKLHCPTCDYKWEPFVKNVTTRNQTCPRCNLGQSSKAEEKLYLSTLNRYPKALRPYRLPVAFRSHKKTSIDIFVPHENIPLVIEYDGSHWHKDRYSIDSEKTMVVLNKGYALARIREQTPHQKLNLLDIEHPYLIQLKHNYSLEELDFNYLVDTITTWYASLLPPVSPQPPKLLKE